MAFPYFSPGAPRRGDPRCSLVPARAASICGAPATWHVAWRFAPGAVFSFACDEHMATIRRDFAYVDRHPAEVACDMPGTGWLLATPSRCEPVTTEDPVVGIRIENPEPAR